MRWALVIIFINAEKQPAGYKTVQLPEDIEKQFWKMKYRWSGSKRRKWRRQLQRGLDQQE